MLDIIGPFWEIWLDIVSSTSFFGAFRAHFRIKITLVTSQKLKIMLDIIGAFWETPPPEKSKKFRAFANFQKKVRPFFGVKNTVVNPSIFPFLDVILAEFPSKMTKSGKFLPFFHFSLY